MSLLDYNRKKAEKNIIAMVGELYTYQKNLDKVSAEVKHIAFQKVAEKIQSILVAYETYTNYKS